MERLTKPGIVSSKDINDLLELSNGNQNGRNQAYYKLKEYEDMEEKLNGISIKQVVNGFIKVVENKTKEEYKNGIILSNNEAKIWNEFTRCNVNSLGELIAKKQNEAIDKVAEQLHSEEFDNAYGINVVLTPRQIDDMAEDVKNSLSLKWFTKIIDDSF